MTDNYPNLRALAAERERSSVHTERRLARALLAALDTMRGGCSNCAAGDHDCKGGDCRCGCRRLAALEAEAGRD